PGGRETSTRPSERAPAQHEEVRGPERGAIVEQLEARPLDAVENVMAAKPGEAQLQSQAAGHAVANSPSLIEPLPGGGDTGLNRTGPAGRQMRLLEIGFLRSAGVGELSRHIQSACAPVAPEVLPEVGQLQRGAQRIGRSIERLTLIAGDAEHESPDRIRRSTVVVELLRQRSIASRRGILAERADEIVESSPCE